MIRGALRRWLGIDEVRREAFRHIHDDVRHVAERMRGCPYPLAHDIHTHRRMSETLRRATCANTLWHSFHTPG